MKSKLSHKFLHAYGILFLVYLILPLLVMGGAAFNSSKFPSPLPWTGFTWRWFQELVADGNIWCFSFTDMKCGTSNTVWVALTVVALSVPIGTGAAILLNNLKGRFRMVLYAVMIAPVLTPGVVIGVSTLVFWFKFGVPAGLHLSILGQASFISAYVMLMVLARLQSFDSGLEEAALDLGASHWQSLRRILLPHLYPALATSAVLAFFQSVENYNTTQFTRGQQMTLTVYYGSRGRSGVLPTINALAVILIAVTVVATIGFEIWRRRSEAQKRLAA